MDALGDAVVPGTFIASAVIGFVVGRWWTVLVPITALGVFCAGIKAGWWGNGVGDGWQFAFAFVIGLGVLAAVAGVLVRRLFRPRPEGPAPWQARG